MKKYLFIMWNSLGDRYLGVTTAVTQVPVPTAMIASRASKNIGAFLVCFRKNTYLCPRIR